MLDGGDEIAYDRLIVATGAANNYFGNDAWARARAQPEDAGGRLRDPPPRAARLRARRARDRRRAARRAGSPSSSSARGATGVELAGAFAEIARHTLHGEFRRIDPRNARVVLVEGGDRVLPTYPPDLSERARVQLERLGVTVWLGRRVTGIDAEGVQMGARPPRGEDRGLGGRRRRLPARRHARRAARRRRDA